MYIWQTTGPRAMARFFRRRDIAPQVKGMRYLECNHFRHPPKTLGEKRLLDVISTVSSSYFTQTHSIHVPVGRGDAQLPLEIQNRRMFGKSAARALRLRPSVVAPSQASPLAIADVDPTPDAVVPPTDHNVVASPLPPSGDNSIGVESLCRCAEYRCPHCVSKGGYSPAATRAKQKMFLQASKADVNRDRANELKAHFKIHRRCVSTQVMLDSMSQELRAWMIEDWEDVSRPASSCSAPRYIRFL